MKNNFITKIIGATLAFAMMIGGAVGINAAKQAKEVDATAGASITGYTQATNVSDITSHSSGKFLIAGVSGGVTYLMPNTSTAASTLAGVSTSDIEDLDDYTFDIVYENSLSGYSIKGASRYYGYGNSGTNITVNTSASTNKYAWTITKQNSGGSFRVANVGASGRAIVWRSGTTMKFGAYSTGNINSTEYFDVEIYYASAVKTLAGISVTTAPTKTKYVPTESFDSTGMAITATYSDESTSSVALSECTFEPTVINQAGNVTITYQQKTATQPVTVYGIESVTGVADGHPTEVELNSTSLTKDDVLVNVLCDDSQTRTIHPTSISYDFSSVGTATVTCTYSYATGTNTATFDVNVINPGQGTLEDPYTVTKAYQIASALANNAFHGHAVYIKGIISTADGDITVDQSNHRANFNITDGQQTIYAYQINECTKTNEDGFTQIGQYYEVVIRGDLKNYGGTYEICYNNSADKVCLIQSATAPALTSITAVVNSGTYYAGNHLVASNFTVTGHYTNGKPSSTIESGFTWTVNGQADGTLNEGDNVIVVSYQGKTSGNLNVTAEHASYADMVRNLTTKTTLSYRFHKEIPSVEETLNRAFTGKTGTSYGDDWENDTSPYGITYTGNSAGGNDVIQLRSKDNSGIVVSANADDREVRQITINWYGENAAGRTIDVYGKNTAYSASSELYGNNKGTLIESVCFDDADQAVITVDNSYKYFGLRSNSGALYVESIVVKWSGDPEFTYSDVSIRFGGLISKTLWNDLDTNEHLISGFGVMITNNDNVAQNETIGEFAEIAEPAGDNPDFDNEYVDYYMSKAEMATPVEQGDNYVWNLFHSIPTQDLSKVYVAAAYIKVGNEYIFMKQERYSAVTLAADYLNNRGYNDNAASGSLYNLAHLQQA